MAISVSDHFKVEIPGTGGELKEGVVGLPHMINPVLAVTDVDRDISALTYSGLMRYANGSLVTDLAQSYKVSDDGLVYTFELRPKIYFSDGTPLTTADIAYTIQKVQDVALKSPRRGDWNNVSVSVTSPSEIKFILKQPYSPFINNTTIGILPKHIWANLNDDQLPLSEYNIEPVGSGPYELKSLVRDAGGIPKEFHLAASSRYYDKKPYLSAVTFYFFSDSDKAFSALQNGTIDSLASVSSDQAGIIKKDHSDTDSVISSPLPRIFGVFFNQSNNPVLADKSVRQALDLSVDRQSIIKNVLNGYGLAIHGPLPFETNVSINLKTSSFSDKPDLAAAATILEKAGWKKNPSTGIYEKKGLKNTVQTLSFNIFTADTSDLKEAAEIVKDSWNTLGANVTIKVFESSDLYQNVIRPRKYDALLFGQLIGKDNDLYAFWHSSQRNAPGLNVAMYANNKVDSLLESIRSTSDASTRNSSYSNLNQLITGDVPAVFLYSPDFIYVVPKALRDRSFETISINNITIPSDRFDSIIDWFTTTENVWKIFANK